MRESPGRLCNLRAAETKFIGRRGRTKATMYMVLCLRACIHYRLLPVKMTDRADVARETILRCGGRRFGRARGTIKTSRHKTNRRSLNGFNYGIA